MNVYSLVIDLKFKKRDMNKILNLVSLISMYSEAFSYNITKGFLGFSYKLTLVQKGSHQIKSYYNKKEKTYFIKVDGNDIF